MVSRVRVPRLDDKNIVIRLAKDDEDVRAANELITRTYVKEGFWREEDRHIEKDRWLTTPSRLVFVVVDTLENQVIGTASVVKDSPDGLPADSFQPDAMQQLRASRESLVQVTSLAFARTGRQQQKLILFLFKFMIQYLFYYTATDRVLALCNPKHAHFYNSILRFEKLGPAAYYHYAQAIGQLSTLHLLKAHRDLSDYYEPDADDAESFYRFLLVDEHESLRFPDKAFVRRSRHINWSAEARLMDLPIAV